MWLVPWVFTPSSFIVGVWNTAKGVVYSSAYEKPSKEKKPVNREKLELTKANARIKKTRKNNLVSAKRI